MGEFAVVILSGFVIAVGVAFGKLLVYGKGRFRDEAIDDMKRQCPEADWKEKK